MNLWYKKMLLFIPAAVSYGVGVFYSNPAVFGFCNGLHSSDYICMISSAVQVGWPLVALGQMLAVVTIILIFAGEKTFYKWIKFILFYLPVVIAIDYMIYPMTSGFGYDLGSTTVTYSQGIYPFGELLVLITFVMVLKDRITEYRTKTKYPQKIAF